MYICALCVQKPKESKDGPPPPGTVVTGRRWMLRTEPMSFVRVSALNISPAPMFCFVCKVIRYN